MARELGRVAAPNDDHVRLYGLRTAEEDFVPTLPTPVVAGTDWWTNFDDPVWDKHHNIWRIGSGPLGHVRGGHCYCHPTRYANDLVSWWARYDQGREGACVGFGASRAQSERNRVFLDAFWLYNEAKKIDPWAGENYDGTDVNSAMKILARVGHKRIWNGVSGDPNPKYGIGVYRWAKTPEDIAACIGDQRIRTLNAFPVENSWGRDGKRVGDRWDGLGYPHIVWLDADVVPLLIASSGEYAVSVDR